MAETKTKKAKKNEPDYKAIALQLAVDHGLSKKDIAKLGLL